MKDHEKGSKLLLRNPAASDVDDMVEIRRAAWLATYPDKDAGFTKEDIITKLDKDLSPENQQS